MPPKGGFLLLGPVYMAGFSFWRNTMPVYQAGNLNTTSLQAPDLYVIIQPPSQTYINGVPTDGLGLVGVGSWGPVNAPILGIGNNAQAQQYIGPVKNRSHDLATAVAVGVQNNVQNFALVRITDGTDVAATVSVMDMNATPAIGMTLTGMYSGTVGNTITANVVAGTAASTYRLSIQRQGFTPEVFDNISGTGAVFWANAVAAVNSGQSGLRGPSQIVVATIGVGVAAPNVTATYALAGGTDGVTTITDALLVGTDGLTRTGMYALRKSGVQVGNLVDCQTTTTWTAQLAFGLQEGIYFHAANPPGASVTTSASNLATAGVDGYGINCLVGDWAYWMDNANGVQRMLSPATFTASKQAATSPEQSVLNNPINGLIATQRSLQNLPYSDSEIGQAAQARLEVLTLGAPAGNIFACRTGRNASSNAGTNGDNYTRMTNYIAFTMASAFGYVPGKVQTIDLRRSVKGAMDAFFSNLQRVGMIGNVNAPTDPGWSVQIDASNNPFSQVSLGYMQATVKVTYLSIVRYFLVSIEGGQSVTVNPV